MIRRHEGDGQVILRRPQLKRRDDLRPGFPKPHILARHLQAAEVDPESGAPSFSLRGSKREMPPSLAIQMKPL